MKHVALLLHLLSVVVIVCTAQPSLAAPPTVKAVPAPLQTIPGEILLRFTSATSFNSRQALISAHGGQILDQIPELDIVHAFFPALVKQPNPLPADALIGELAKHPSVLLSERNLVYFASMTPNDPQQASQYAWSTVQAYQAWDTTQGTTQTVVAVVDSGIQQAHPDLDAKLLPGYDYVDTDTTPEDAHGHGTHVAGSTAAETNNRTGGAGMCPACRLLPVRVLDAMGDGSLANVAKGIIYAADHRAQVINLSLGGPASATLELAVNYAWQRGAFLACAAGNENTSSFSMAYPAAYTNCFAVAATTSSDVRASFSNYGTWVEVAAPGAAIMSTWLGGGYARADGTSMATPHVAGLAGLLAGQGLTNAAIRQRICASADPITGTGTQWTCGRINAARAVGAPSSVPATPTSPGAPAYVQKHFVPLIRNH